MKKLIFITLLSLLAVSGWGQNYVRLGDASGYEYSEADLDSLEAAATNLKNLLPIGIKEKFSVIDLGYYSYNNIMNGSNLLDNLWDSIINNKRNDPETPYFLIFGRYMNKNKPYIKVHLNLPMEGFNSCFTESFYSSLNNNLQNLCNTLIVSHGNYSMAIKESINSCKSKLNKIIFCCENNLRSEECSVCKLNIDEISTDLEAKGFFELSTIFDLCEHSKYNLVIKTKQYTNINSSVEIIFNNSDSTKIYNFTDALEEYLNDKNNYEVNVKVYDDNIAGQEICYEEDNNFFSRSGNRSNLDYNQNIVVLNYFDEKKVYVKLEVDRKPCEPLNVYIADKTHEFNDQFKRFNLPTLYNFMDKAFDHCRHIYDKNGYANLFTFNKIKTNSELDALTMDDFNILYYFRDQPYSQCFTGITTFYLPQSFTLNLDKNAMSSCRTETSAHGNVINLAKHDLVAQPFQLGFTLAHEILHVLTIRGARLMKMPQKDFCNEVHIQYCNGGHLNDLST